jgi:hypothetical protein
VLLLDDDDALPHQPSSSEAALTARIGPEGLDAIDEALARHAARHWRKVARVVLDAVKASGSSLTDEPLVQLHVRRLMTLVERGVLESQGNLRRPRWSEVRLRTDEPEPSRSTYDKG